MSQPEFGALRNLARQLANAFRVFQHAEEVLDAQATAEARLTVVGEELTRLAASVSAAQGELTGARREQERLAATIQRERQAAMTALEREIAARRMAAAEEDRIAVAELALHAQHAEARIQTLRAEITSLETTHREQSQVHRRLDSERLDELARVQDKIALARDQLRQIAEWAKASRV